MMKLYRGPWIWDKETMGGSWSAPQGTIGSIDLRPLSSQGKQATIESVGLFMTDANLPSPYELLTGKRGEMASIAYDLLTTNPDHEGITAHKPLLPNGDRYEVFLGDTKIEEKLVRSGKMWDATCRVIQADVEKIHAHNPMLARKYLGFLERQHGDYSKFVPSRLVGLKSVKPETTYTDDFNRANDTTLGSAWTTTGSSEAGFQVNSNQCYYGGSQNDSATRFARYDSDLSSADHYSLMSTISAPQSGSVLGTTVRHSASNVTTCYAGLRLDSNMYIYKIVARSYTAIGGPTSCGANSGSVKTSANGSSITTYHAGTQIIQVTDTGITGNLRCGIWGFGHQFYMDDWSASDLAAAATTRKMLTLGCG